MANPRIVETNKKLKDSAVQIKDSAAQMERSTARVEDSADRRTELAADRTIFAAERTYAAWVRTEDQPAEIAHPTQDRPILSRLPTGSDLRQGQVESWRVLSCIFEFEAKIGANLILRKRPGPARFSHIAGVA
jgi:hypothetical protein